MVLMKPRRKHGPGGHGLHSFKPLRDSPIFFRCFFPFVVFLSALRHAFDRFEAENSGQ